MLMSHPGCIQDLVLKSVQMPSGLVDGGFTDTVVHWLCNEDEGMMQQV